MSTQTALLARGVFASRPAFGIDGRRYIATDTGIEYYDTGAAWAALGGGGTGVLAIHSYALGSDTATSTTGTSFSDVDATNQAITFTAPASGNVLVRVNGLFAAQNTTNNVFFDLREATTDLAGTSRVNDFVASGGFANQIMEFYLTGVSAGSHTYKLGFKTSNAGTSAQVWSGPNFGPILYTVLACP